MARFAVFVVVLAACKKAPPKHEGPIRITLGDCADATSWVSGPRPVSAQEQAAITKGGDGVISLMPRFGGSEISSGYDDKDLPGGLTGDETATGGFGFGRSGFGPQNGPSGSGTIGTGRYGTIGRGSGTGSGYGVGTGGMRGRTSAVPTVRIGQPNAQGDLDKAIIRRYIKRNITKIQYCYEKELLAKPKLTGTTTVQFVIKPDGTVASASGAGFDADVDACVAGVIKSIEFPKPKGGGGVQVSYPFTFYPTGDTNSVPAPKPPEGVKPKEPVAVTSFAPYTQGDANPLAAKLPELLECVRTHEQSYGAVTVKLGLTAEVHGLSEDAATCVAELAKTLGGSQTCSFAFGEIPKQLLPTVEITADAIKFAGATIADPRKEELMFKIPALFERVETLVNLKPGALDIVGPIIVLAPDKTPIEVVTKVATTIRAAKGNYVFGIDDGLFGLTRPRLSLPIPPVPAGTGGRWFRGSIGGEVETEAVKLSVLIQQDKIWVGLSRVNEFTLVEGRDWDKLESTLATHKKTAFFADRYDIEIAGEGATYGDLIKTIEAATTAGFTSVQFGPPVSLSAQPTL